MGKNENLVPDNDFNSFGFTSLLEELDNANFQDFQNERTKGTSPKKNLEVSINFTEENEKQKTMFKNMTKYLAQTIRRKSKILTPIPENLKSLDRVSTAEDSFIVAPKVQEEKSSNNAALFATLNMMNKRL